ncbi:hypothetical protein MKEN_00481800 [Mycena kentingensis (nom. inval.)]|nr:hypothetical protein MKEN_00481800 [Mycena kentingensis (nom. inval.)]
MSTCFAMGFSAVAGGPRLSAYNQQTGHTAYHNHHLTALKTTSGEFVPAKIRVYASSQDAPLPDNTLAFIIAKMAAPAGNPDHIPDQPTFIFGVGHIPTEDRAPIPSGSKGFNIALSEYVTGAMTQFDIQCMFPTTPRWRNTPLPRRWSCTEFAGHCAGRTPENILRVTIDHITLGLAPHVLGQGISATTSPSATPSTPQRRKYVTAASPIQPASEPVASSSKQQISTDSPTKSPPKQGVLKRAKYTVNNEDDGEEPDVEEPEEPEEVTRKSRGIGARRAQGQETRAV